MTAHDSSLGTSIVVVAKYIENKLGNQWIRNFDRQMNTFSSFLKEGIVGDCVQYARRQGEVKDGMDHSVCYRGEICIKCLCRCCTAVDM